MATTFRCLISISMTRMSLTISMVHCVLLLVLASSTVLWAGDSMPQQGIAEESYIASQNVARSQLALPVESVQQSHHPLAIEATHGPRIEGIHGWRPKYSYCKGIGLAEVNAPDFETRVSALIGRNPFIIRTQAGQMNIDRGLHNDLKAKVMSLLWSQPSKDLICVLIPSVPAQMAVEDYLKDLGVKVLSPMAPNAYRIKADADTISYLAKDPLVYGIAQLPWNMKIDPMLAEELDILGVQKTTLGDKLAVEMGKARVVLYDKDDKLRIRSKLETMGILIEHFDDVISAFMCHVTDAYTVVNIANMQEVSYIEAPRITKTALQTSLDLSGHHDVIRYDGDYESDITIGMIDSGLEYDHTAFREHGSRPELHIRGWNVSGEGGPNDVWVDNPSGHGTFVAGIMLSRWSHYKNDWSDPNWKGHLLGMAPRSGGDSAHAFRVVRCGRDTNDVNDMRKLYNVPQAMDTLAADNQALVINCSFGTKKDNSGSTERSVRADKHVWEKNQIYVFAAGNDGTAEGTIDSPAAAKNVIAVGAVNNNTTQLLYDASSEGPTRDGRKKPDIYAPGRDITSADANDPNGWRDAEGTSLAAPHVTGFFATLLGLYPWLQRRPASAKAWLIASSKDPPYLWPYVWGSRGCGGILNSYHAHFATENTWMSILYSDNPQPYPYVYWDLYDVPAGMQQMRIALTWIEPECSEGDFYTVHNDVDLWVDHAPTGLPSLPPDCNCPTPSDPNCKCHDPNCPCYDPNCVLGEWKSISLHDNVEFIDIADPPPGNYRVIARQCDSSTPYRIGCAVQYKMNINVPDSPSGFSHIDNTPNSISWTWKDNSDNETGYVGYSPENLARWWWLGLPPPMIEHYLRINTRYTRYVSCFNLNGDSAPSNSHSAYTSIETPTFSPFFVPGTTSIGVSINNLTGLTRGNSGLIIENVTQGTNSGWRQNNDVWDSNSLSPNIRYDFRAKARNGDGDETPYSTSYAYTLANLPGVASFTDIGPNSVQANWTTNGNSAGTEYFCENTTAGTNSGWITDTFWNSTGLDCATVYFFRVKARNNDGWETDWAELGGKYTLPDLPGAAPLSDITTDSIRANWTTNTNPPAVEYFCENSEAGTNSGWTTGTSWDSTGLMIASSYSFHVKARNADGDETAWASLGSKYTLANPPGAASFSNITADSIQTNWTHNGNPAGTLYFCENKNAGTNSGWSNSTSWSSTGLVCGFSYSFRVKARNGDNVDTDWTDLGSQNTLPCAWPDINVKQGPNDIPHNTGSFNFGYLNVDSSRIVTFTIENLGGGLLDLTGLPPVTIGGTNADRFAVIQQPSTPVSPAGSVTFEVTFNPIAVGLCSAAVSIPNNDPDENPYTFSLVGSGLADLNGDGSVDLKDLQILSTQWLQSPSNHSADIFPPGGDGIVNLPDFALLANHWLETTAP